MPPVRILTRLESETVHLPGVEALVGKDVEIVVREQAAVRAMAAPEKWRRFFAKRRGAVVDPKLIEEYREYDASQNIAWCDDPH